MHVKLHKGEIGSMRVLVRIEDHFSIGPSSENFQIVGFFLCGALQNDPKKYDGDFMLSRLNGGIFGQNLGS